MGKASASANDRAGAESCDDSVTGFVRIQPCSSPTVASPELGSSVLDPVSSHSLLVLSCCD